MSYYANCVLTSIQSHVSCVHNRFNHIKNRNTYIWTVVFDVKCVFISNSLLKATCKVDWFYHVYCKLKQKYEIWNMIYIRFTLICSNKYVTKIRSISSSKNVYVLCIISFELLSKKIFTIKCLTWKVVWSSCVFCMAQVSFAFS